MSDKSNKHNSNYVGFFRKTTVYIQHAINCKIVRIKRSLRSNLWQNTKHARPFVFGNPLRPVNLVKATRKAPVDKSEQTSKWTAFVITIKNVCILKCKTFYNKRTGKIDSCICEWNRKVLGGVKP